jgi:hypothetical protein
MPSTVRKTKQEPSHKQSKVATPVVPVLRQEDGDSHLQIIIII